VIAVLGGLGAAAAWAISTLCSSRSSRILDPPSVVAWMMLVGLAVCAPLAAAGGVPARLNSASAGWLVLSGAGNVGGLMITYRALRIGQVALVAPLVSTEGAVAAIIAVGAGEALRPAVGAALGLAALGLCVAAIPRGGLERARRTRHLESVLLAAAAALAFGTSLYATARAGAELPSAWVVLAARAVGTGALLVPLALAGRLRLARSAVPLIVASGLCEVAGFFAYTAGARHGIAIAAVLASQVGALAAVGGYLLFGERLGRVQLAGVTTVLVAVALISGLQA